MNENMNPRTSADMNAYEKAVDSIRDQMAANPKDGAIDIVGNFLTELLRLNPHHAPLILAEGKTIKGAMEEMKKEAAKHKSGSWAALDFYTGTRVVLKYYGLPDMEPCEINSVINGLMEHTTAPVSKPVQAPAPADEFDIDSLLADLEG